MIKSIASKLIHTIGSGGNINKLYRLAPKTERKKELLMVSALENLYAELSPLSVEERIELYDLREDRADVIVPAQLPITKVSFQANTWNQYLQQ